MSGHERWEHDLGAYVLGALEGDEARRMEAHLAECPRCRSDERRLAVSLDALAAAVPQVSPPRGLRRKVMRAVRTDGGSARPRAPLAARSGWRPAVALGAAALTAAAVGGYALRGDDVGDPGRTLAGRATPAAPSASGRLVVQDGNARLAVARLARPRPGHVYQVWLREERRIRPSVLFSVDRHGRAEASIPGGLEPAVDEVMVSEEPAGGSEAPTSPPRLRFPVT
jgi:anti-sigma-K factor RskA